MADEGADRRRAHQTDREGKESRFEDRRSVLPGNRPNSPVRATIVLSAGGGGWELSEVSRMGLKGEDVTTEGHVNTPGSKYRQLEPISVFFRASEFASKLRNASL